MSIKSFLRLPKAKTIAMIWVVVSLTAAAAIGLIAIPIWSGDAVLADPEKVFIRMTQEYFNPWLGGVLLAAILAAIMSTIDSQLLVCSSTLTEDVYKRLTKKDIPDRKQVAISRIFVLVISLFALILALTDMKTIFAVVKFAWGGFGAAFGPVILCSLYCRGMSRTAALSGMIGGLAVMLPGTCSAGTAGCTNCCPVFLRACFLFGSAPGFPPNAIPPCWQNSTP